MNYATFKSKPIMTLSDLGQIGAHNQRKKEAYKSNSDIKIKKVYDEVDTYAKSYRSLEKRNDNIQKEVKMLKYKN